MEKITMHQELEMLRKEVEDLKKQKEEAEIEAQKTKELEEAESKEIEETIVEEIKEDATEAKENLHENLNELIEAVKNDYETLSPVAALVLFALGAAFGRAISSK